MAETRFKLFILVSMPLIFIEKYTITLNSDTEDYRLLESDANW
jgi:hypothetical protein